MVLPLYKALSLVIRVFSRPLINHVKKSHLKTNGDEPGSKFEGFFIWLGNSSNRWESWINRKFMKIDSQFAFKPLNDELAIEKGIQFFYEILFYSILIGLPLYEMVRASNEADEKSRKMNQRLENIEQNLAKISRDIGKLEEGSKPRLEAKGQTSQEDNRKGFGTISLMYPNGSTHSYQLL